MAVKPFGLLDQYGNAIIPSYYGGGNAQFESASSSTQRKTIQELNKDLHQNIDRTGLKQMRSYSRWISSNFPEVDGAIQQIATLSVSSLLPQFYGNDKRWGNLAEEYLYNSNQSLVLNGWPHDGDSLNGLIAVSRIIDGDIGLLLTEDNGDPKVQVIGAHRINSYSSWAAGIPGYKNLDGSKIISGVVVNSTFQPQLYILTDSAESDSAYYEPKDLMCCFVPRWPNQVRGLPVLASALNYIVDVANCRLYELIAQQVASSISLIETNDTGVPDTAQQALGIPTEYSGSTPTGAFTQTIGGGTIRYVRANSGNKIEAFQSSRPSTNAMEFSNQIIRAAFNALEWSVDFFLDPSKVGGASGRIVLATLMRTIRKNRAFVEKIRRRIDSWRVVKAMQSGRLQPSNEWWKWDYQGPPDITADAGYDSQIRINELQQGITTKMRVCGERGIYWEEIDQQRELEVRALVQRARSISTDLNIPFETALNLLQKADYIPQEQQKPTQQEVAQ